MSWERYRVFLITFAIACSVGLPSCGRDQQLVSIAIQPATEIFGSATIPVAEDAGLNVQLSAVGTYIHPPVIKDITDQVTWASNTPGIATVNSTGLVTATGQDCGNSLVSATVTKNSSDGGISSSGAIVTNFMTATVVCFTGTGPTVTVDFAGTGTGTISSSPGGLGCATTCSASFPMGSSITLTAIASSGHSFGGWAGCNAVSGPVCVISDLINNFTVTVTFN
jgi:hypothetical protein